MTPASAAWFLASNAVFVRAGRNCDCGNAPAVCLRLLDTLSSQNSKAADRFTAALVEPLVMDRRIVKRKDALETSQVVKAVTSARLNRNPEPPWESAFSPWPFTCEISRQYS